MIDWNRFLPFWAGNMIRVRKAGMDWMGFRYTPEEWARLERHAKGIGDGTMRAFLAINAVLFIVMAAILIAVILVPLLNVLYPDPSKLSALVFFSILGAIIAISFGLGLPSTMAITARMLGGALPSGAAGDKALVAKVRWQINRMGLFVTALAFALIGISIAFGIDLGPALRAIISIASFAVTGLTTVMIFKKR